MARCRLVLTDSGGVQEEAPSLGQAGARDARHDRAPGRRRRRGRRCSSDPALRASSNTQVDCSRIDEAYLAMANAVSPYGDGRAAQRIVARVRRQVKLPEAGEGPRP